MRLLWIFLCFGIAQAQTLYFAVSINSLLQIEPELRLENLEFEDTKIDLRVAYQKDLEFGVAMRQSTSFGPLGNIALEGQADVSSTGQYQISLNAKGVIAALAASLGGSIFNVLPGGFQGIEAFTLSRPRFTKGSSLDMGLSYRLSRNEVLSAYPSLYFLEDGFAGKLDADYKIYKRFEPHDASFLLQTYLSPVGHHYGAVGFQFDLNDKTLPSMTASAWLGLGHQGIWPGLKASLSQTFKSIDGKLGISLGLEPYRTDFIPYYFQASYSQHFDFGVLEAHLYSSLGTEHMSSVGFQVGYAYKF
jgi:hypothetical protein